MKKTLFIILSIVLGCMASSCQNDIENELNIFEETATTRAIDEDNEIEKDSPIRSISISGDDIISGTEQKTYTAPSYNQTTYKMNWVYDSSAFTCMAGGGDNNI